MKNGMTSKYEIGQMVDLAVPTVLIVGVHFHGEGPGKPFRVTYDVLEGSQIHPGVTEDAITGNNVEAQVKIEAEWAEQEAERMAKQSGVERGPKLNLVTSATREGLASEPADDAAREG